MFDPYRSKPSSRGRTNLASCCVATFFLILLIVGIIVVYFFLFKPKTPKIAVDAVQFPTFSVTNGSVNFTFFQYVSVTNPNRDEFTHYDSSLQLSYSGEPVGVVFIPAGKIDGGRTQHMSAKFDVQSYPLPATLRADVSGGGVVSTAAANGGGGVGRGPTMEVETRMKLVGRVRVLKVFTHRVDSGVKCKVVIQVSSGSVLGVRC
ncbi:uncharacterized protein [Nicotiana tomentosiformis]|uniref:Uncharacterized protein n=1 Tax=Nicotiana tabacum TaxID=4097 RepID=A0A1S3ZI70_TOBAC|nr:PREDICTED: uncharacterized protein LOC107760276 [Nicotiana tabacum]XP_016463947.1 PREDICTED: uncharacterized protein LOC107786947 [Nicotiana tabacum]